MTSVNKGDFFQVEFVSLMEKEVLGGWVLTFQVVNLGVDVSYFDQCLKNCYADASNALLEGNLLKFTYLSEVEEVEAVCEAVAENILDELSKHSEWGKVGGPDIKDDFGSMD